MRKKLYKTQEAAEIIGKSVQTISNWIKQKKIQPTEKQGRSHLFDTATLKEMKALARNSKKGRRKNTKPAPESTPKAQKITVPMGSKITIIIETA